MDWLSAAVQGVSNLGASIFNYNSQKKANATNIQLSREQMDFQREMSNTAVQRHAKDLEAAGFNRLLAAGANGASTPSGSAATVKAPEVTPIDIIGIQKARADISKTKAETAVAGATAENLIEQNKNLQAQNVVLQNQAAKILKDMGYTDAQIRKTLVETADKEHELVGKQGAASFDGDGSLIRGIKSIIRMVRTGEVSNAPIDAVGNYMSRSSNISR